MREHGDSIRKLTACRTMSSMVFFPDHQGRLWLPTNKGLARFTPATGDVRMYDATDGLQGNEFNQGAAFRGRDGIFYLGGINGFNAFLPDSIPGQPYIPPVYLTSLRIFDRTVPLPQALSATNAIELRHDQNFLSCEFVALSYTAPAKNRYRYMLRDWTKPGSTPATDASQLPISTRDGMRVAHQRIKQRRCMEYPWRYAGNHDSSPLLEDMVVSCDGRRCHCRPALSDVPVSRKGNSWKSNAFARPSRPIFMMTLAPRSPKSHSSATSASAR